MHSTDPEFRKAAASLSALRIKLDDRAGGHVIVVPQTMYQAAQLIEELRARVERNENLLRQLVEIVAPMIEARKLGE